MRTQAQVLIALSLLACLVAAAPSCSLLNNQSDLCQAANSLCTWSALPANNACSYDCPLGSEGNDACTAIKGCTYTASTCALKTDCSKTAQADCTAGNNCAYTDATCTANPNANATCSNGTVCLDPLPANCSKTTTSSCGVNAASTNTCPQGVAQNACTAPCSTATAVATCTDACAGLLETPCGANASCTWSGTACAIATGLAQCSTVVATCANNPQCTAGTTYNCSTTPASLATLCNTNVACTATQAGWCSTTNVDTCSINKNYCVLTQANNGCTTDAANCSYTQGSCATADPKACTWSADKTTCDQTLCTGAYSTCVNSAGGCTVAGTGCTPADASCTFKAGGTCAANSSSTNGYIIAFCASILAFVLAF